MNLQNALDHLLTGSDTTIAEPLHHYSYITHLFYIRRPLQHCKPLQRAENMKHTEQTVRDIYAPLATGDFATYMQHVADDVDWVIGNPDLKTFPPAGRYDVGFRL
jgi:hypothetical protein